MQALANRKEHQMYTPEQIKLALRDRNIKLVAQASGLCYGTVRRAALGISRPSYDTAYKLSQYIDSVGGLAVKARVNP
jgi:hypothetical protein